ncbi:hypothetical protein M0R89_05825 [Halorussus limi]|uniref:Uncharacterized protein n=1 Tax=Halorussus limi TaxID=2938695 RepID=A0A8U0HXV1_9EURY|nr:hypothetical protein [Halorussus limi]UPV75583.1 hypothetical protein M0R89_05825 [Halorussus limi]
MTVSEFRTLLAEPVGAFVCYVVGSLCFSLVAAALLPVSWVALLAFAVACYTVSAKAMLASRSPSPPSGIDYGRESGVGNYGKWEARNFVRSMSTIALVAALSAPVFFGELRWMGETAESSFATLFYLGVVPTAYWMSDRLTAQYLPSYRPHLYPDDYTRPLDGQQGE